MPNILIIDDNADLRDALRLLLEKFEHEIFEAADGKEGINIFKKSPVDLIITDLIMPEKDGIEAIIELKQYNKDVKIIAISGGGKADPDSYLRAAKKLGADRALAKPFKNEALIRMINELLE